MQFTTSIILQILQDNGIRTTLDRAFKIATKIYDLHCERVNFVENNAYARGLDAGRKIGREEAEKEDSVRARELREIEEAACMRACAIAPEIADKYPIDKPRAVKAMRSATGLPLRICNEIMTNVYKERQENAING